MLKLCWIFETNRGPWAVLARARYLNSKGSLVNFLSSSIWTAVRDWREILAANSSWWVGNGKSISFWHDKWLEAPLAELITHPPSDVAVSEFIHQHKWFIPATLATQYLDLFQKIISIDLPLIDQEDNLVWTNSSSGALTFKTAFNFLQGQAPTLGWPSKLLQQCIPPSRSFLLWRLLHQKIPTDDILQKHGWSITSICCHCGSSSESANHLFLACPFAVNLWQWFSSKILQVVDTSSFLNVLNLADNHSSQIQDLLLAGVVNIIWYIWYSRNRIRFHNQHFPLGSIKANITLAISLSTSKSKGTMFPSIQDFCTLKNFKTPCHPRRNHHPIPVYWQPPRLDWI